MWPFTKRNASPKPEGSHVQTHKSWHPLSPAKMDKAGHNDLSRWGDFGGALKRPPPPMPYKKRDPRP